MPIETHLYERVLSYEDGEFFVHDPDDRFADLKSKFKYDLVRGRWVTKDLRKALTLRAFANARAKSVFGRYFIVEQKVDLDDFAHPATLTPLSFQIPAAHFLLSRNRSYLWADPGLGKTVIAALANNHTPGRLFISCPSFLKYHWKRTLLAWSTTGLTSGDIALPESSKDVLDLDPKTPVVILPDSLTPNRKVVEKLMSMKFDRGIIDEAHRFKTIDSKRTVGVYGGFVSDLKRRKYVRGIESVCKQVVSLSGTAMPNFRPMELYPIIFSQCPGEIDFLNQHEFGMKYCAGYHDGYGFVYNGASEIPELHRRLWGKFFLRLEKEHYLKELPDKTREIVFLDGAKTTRFVTDFSKTLLSSLTVGEILARLGGDEASLGDIARLRRELGEAKIQPAVEFLIDRLETTHEKIIVFAYHRDVIEALDRQLKRFGSMKIWGDTDARDKDVIAQTFQRDANTRVLVCNLQAAGVGLTLTAANRVVFVEYDWQPAVNLQAEDRAHRIGQKDNVFCEYLVVPNTLDEPMLKTIFNKLEQEEKFNQAEGGSNESDHLD